jgi:hypothetical protein
MHEKKIVILILGVTILVCLTETVVSGNKLTGWHIKNRFQAGAEIDDNIYESRYELVSEPSLRFLLQSCGNKQFSRLNFNFRITGGYQGYEKQAREDKFTGESQFSSELRLNKTFFCGINFQWRTKFFIYEPIDYSLLTSNFYTRFALPFQTSLFIFYRPHSLNYRASTFYDFQGTELGLVLSKNISRHLALEANFSQNQLKYQRNIYKISLPNQLIYQDEKQLDNLSLFSFQASYLSFLLVKLGYFYEVNKSNNFGFSYQKQYWVFNFSKKFFSDYLIQFYLTFQNKNYNDQFGPFFQMQLDTEQEENNFFIVDISRTFTSNTSIFLRYGYYKNESPFRSEYYQKQLITTGLEIRF